MHPISQPPDRPDTLHHAGQITPSEVIHNQEDLKYHWFVSKQSLKIGRMVPCNRKLQHVPQWLLRRVFLVAMLMHCSSLDWHFPSGRWLATRVASGCRQTGNWVAMVARMQIKGSEQLAKTVEFGWHQSYETSAMRLQQMWQVAVNKPRRWQLLGGW